MSGVEFSSGGGANSVALKTLETRVAVQTLRDILKDGWGPLGLVDGAADAFTDETGISSNTGAVYDAAGDFYHNLGSENLIDNMSNIGDATLRLVNAFDLTNSQGQVACATRQDNIFLGQDYGVGVSHAPSRVEIWPSNDWGFYGLSGSITLTVFGSNVAPAFQTDGVQLAETVAPDSVAVRTISVIGGAAFRYLWVRAISSVQNGSSLSIAELKFYKTLVVSITAVSVSSVASTPPNMGRVVLLHEPVHATTLNTDITVELSRDGGVTWTAGVLTKAGDYDASIDVLVADDIALGAQPSGVSLQWRLKTLNGKEQRFHGVYSQWA